MYSQSFLWGSGVSFLLKSYTWIEGGGGYKSISEISSFKGTLYSIVHGRGD